METLTSEKVYTVEEYLEREEKSFEKHEFHNGKIIPVSGASFIHNAIAVNVITALKVTLRGKSGTYHVTNSDTKIWIEAIKRFVYPDAAVVSGFPTYFETRTDIITNPLLVIEILSPGTQKKDRMSKFDNYRTLSSLKEYVLVNQNRATVSTFSQAKAWQETRVQETDQQMYLASLDIMIPLADIYEGIEALRG